MNRLDVYRQTRKEEKQEETENEFPPLLDILREKLGGFTVEEDSRKVLVVRKRIAGDFIHGNVRLSEILKFGEEKYYSILFNRELNKSKTPLLNRLIFFDIESTGLSGGAGTKAFLIGTLTVENGELVLTQYFLPNLFSEPLFLRNIKNSLFKSDKILVSYNGKSYDSNIIKNRMIINRIDFDDNDPIHFDLLHTSRRVWKGKFPDYTLQRVESLILGYKRKDDIPGYLIPDIFSRYLRGYNVLEELIDVFKHNRDDLLSLFGILTKQIQIVAESLEGNIQKTGKDINPVSVSDMLVKGKMKGEALRLLDVYNDDPDAIKKKALLLKKDMTYKESIKYFERLALKAKNPKDIIFAYIEIAKIYEHRLRDIKKALEYTIKAMEILRRSFYLYTEYRHYQNMYAEHLGKRVSRLEKKLIRVKE